MLKCRRYVCATLLSQSHFLPSFSFAPHLTLHIHSQPSQSIKIPGFQNVDDAVSSFLNILNKRHPPSEFEINKILGSIVKMKHYATAISLFPQLEQLIAFRSGTGSQSSALLLAVGCFPNVVTYEIFIKALLEKNENDKAKNVVHEMIARGLLKR